MGNPVFELPATFEMVVWFTDGETMGKVTVNLSSGEYPRQEKIEAMIEEAKKAVEGSGLHLCDPHEFGRAFFLEKTGQKVAIPGANEWAKPYSS